MYKSFIVLFTLLFAFQTLNAQTCPDGQVPLIVDIVADDYPQETTWTLADRDGNLIAIGNVQGDTVCVDTGICLVFTINDDFGDGICCAYGNGSYSVYLDGALMVTGGQFGDSETTPFNCPEGFSCLNAIAVDTGSHIAPSNNHWYVHTPAETGIYTLSTCDDNDCDTKLWLYDYCLGDLTEQSNEGTIYYDDNAGGCGEQAKITAYLEEGITYYFRIGSDNDDCEVPINWTFSFGGTITGCMDSTACNFNPLANEDDGSCIYDGHPDCATGPDLVVLEDVLYTSIYAAVINNNTDDCMIDEGCLQGFGRRQIVRFTTWIKNIGDMDYFIGAPSGNPDQFSFDNCHNHYHYEGYAEYRLADADNVLQPVGFKNGFCVLDLECSDGGTPKYGCGNMGITGHCGDIYSSGLDCQWIDVTDLEEGDYTLVVTVNWDQSPDALGNVETDYSNNWAQICFTLNRNVNGDHDITINTPCEAYVDCLGVPYGNAEIDCLGNCNGANQFGDLNADGNQTSADAQQYIDDILSGGMEATNCFDLNNDDAITVYDAALINSCVLFGDEHNHPNDGNVHDHCNLPGGVVNPNHEAQLTILDVDYDNKTIDIGISNPLDHIVGYEFEMSGITITNVQNIAAAEFPVTPEFSVTDSKIIGLSLVDSSLTKSVAFQPLCRIKYSEITGEEICIANITDIVNNDYHKIESSIEAGCASLPTGLFESGLVYQFDVYPNPNDGKFSIDYHFRDLYRFELTIENHIGQIVYEKQMVQSQNGSINIDLSDEANGVCFIRIRSDKGVLSKKVVVTQ